MFGGTKNEGNEGRRQQKGATTREQLARAGDKGGGRGESGVITLSVKASS